MGGNGGLGNGQGGAGILFRVSCSAHSLRRYTPILSFPTPLGSPCCSLVAYPANPVVVDKSRFRKGKDHVEASTPGRGARANAPKYPLALDRRGRD